MVYDFSAFFSCAPWWTDITELSQCFMVLLFVLKYVSFCFEIMKIRVCFSYLAVEGGRSLPRVYALVSRYDVAAPSARSLPCPVPARLALDPRAYSISCSFHAGAVPFWACSLLTGLCFFLPQLHFPYIFISVCPLPCWCFSKLSCLFLAPFSFIF